MRDGRFEQGDIVTRIDTGLNYWFVCYDGKTKYGDNPWIEDCVVVPLNKDGKTPDKRSLDSRRSRFNNRILCNLIKLAE